MQPIIVPPIKTVDDARRVLDVIARALNTIAAGGGISGAVATETTFGTVKVDDESGGDPVALTELGHGSELSPHAGHAKLVSGKVPTNELGSGVADATKVLKGDQTWGSASGTIGPQGPPGIPGPPMMGRDGRAGASGFPGPKGDPGAAGAAGPPGPGILNVTQILPAWGGPPGKDSMIPGPMGPPGAGAVGATGAKGDMIFVRDGLHGRDSMIPGPKGDQGAQGLPGAAGSQGPASMMALDGKPGAMGFPVPGPQGAPGTPGAAGTAGLGGMPGRDGQRGRDAVLLGPVPGAPAFIAKRLGANYTNNAVALTAVAGLTVPLSVGSWLYEYHLCYQSAALTTGIAFSVNFTGTVTTFVNDMFWGAVTASDATAAADQDQILAGTGSLLRVFSNRAKFTTLRGVTISVDTINADMYMKIMGMAEVTVAGNIELWAASEVAASQITVKAGSLLCLTQAL